MRATQNNELINKRNSNEIQFKFINACNTGYVLYLFNH